MIPQNHPHLRLPLLLYIFVRVVLLRQGPMGILVLLVRAQRLIVVDYPLQKGRPPHPPHPPLLRQQLMR